MNSFISFIHSVDVSRYFIYHQITLLLFQIIDPEKSSVKMLGTKVEINLKKMEPGAWPALEARTA